MSLIIIFKNELYVKCNYIKCVQINICIYILYINSYNKNYVYTYIGIIIKKR